MKELRGLNIALVAMTFWCAAAKAQPAVHGSGTTNIIPVFTGSSMIGNSIMNQSGGNINVSGGLVATTLSGNGSGLTNVSAATVLGLPASAFAQLGAGSNAFAGSVSAASFSGSGSGLTNVNAALLGGLSASSFAQLGVSNTFTTGQTINGALTLGGAINNTLTLQGNLNDGVGDLAANVIGGFGGTSSVPGNSVASGVIGATIAGGGGYYGVDLLSVANTVTGSWGTVGGGNSNSAGAFATVSGGGGNTAGGSNSTVPGGLFNNANGDRSFAAGCSASANNTGSFVWSGAIGGDVCFPVSDSGVAQFVALAPGGFTFYTAGNLSTGATLAVGSGSWASVSDRNTKANFSAVDGGALLARLAALPVSSWNYKTQPDSVRHMGPTAQDFRAAFGLGEDDKHISVVDAEGVALAAIQALYQSVAELKRDLGDKDHEIAELRARLARLEQQH